MPVNGEQKGGRYLVTRGGRFCTGGRKEGGRGDDGVYIVHRCCDKEGGEQKRQDQKEEEEEGEIFSNFISQDIQPLRNQQPLLLLLPFSSLCVFLLPVFPSVGGRI